MANNEIINKSEMRNFWTRTKETSLRKKKQKHMSAENCHENNECNDETEVQTNAIGASST